MQLNITQKFVAYLMFFSVLPLLVVGVVSYTTSSRQLRNESERYSQQLVSAELDYLDLLQSQIEGLITNLSGSDDLRDSIDAANAGQTDTFAILTTQSQIGYVLSSYTSIDGLVSIDIFTESGVHYSYGDTLVTQNIRSGVYEKIYDQALNSERRIVWLGVEENVNPDSNQAQVITAARMLTSFQREAQSQIPSALLIVSFSIDELSNHFAQAELSEGSFLVVIDNLGRYVYHPDSRNIGQPIEPELVDGIGAGSGSTTLTLNGESVQVSYARSEISGWVVASLVPVSTFNTLTRPIRDTTVFVLIISFVVVVLAALLYSRDIVAPIRQITDQYSAVDDTQDGQFIPDPLPQARYDEIGELIAAFNRSLDSQREREKLISDLQYATEIAQESSRLKSEFLATVSHELRTPLNSITGYTGILLEGIGGSVDSEAHTLLQRVQKSSGQLLALINDILDLSKIEAGRLEIAAKPINAPQLLQDVVNQVQVMATAKKLDLRLDVAPDFPTPVYFDSERLIQVAMNLISNAIKFTEKGHVRVSLSTEAQHMVLSVSDTGVGIPREAQGYIFDEFRQVDASSKRRYGGTGLGLAIVRKIVQAMDGTIQVESEVGHGSTFTVRLPLLPLPLDNLERVAAR